MRCRFALAFIVLAGTLARADTVYTYTGTDYQDAYGVYTTSDHVSGSFTVASPLPAGKSFDPIAYSSYSFSDGAQTLTNLNSTVKSFTVSTNGSGDIAVWYIDLLSSVGSDSELLLQAMYFSPSDFYTRDVVTYDPSPFDPRDFDLSSAETQGHKGTWTVTSSPATTPEPSGLLLFGTGALATVGVARRRFALRG